MAQAQIYEGIFADITAKYGKALADRRVKIVVEETESNDEPRPFYETATPEEWIAAFREWTASHPKTGIILSDEAIDRDSIYEGRGE
jgi:hypothetical protein